MVILGSFGGVRGTRGLWGDVARFIVVTEDLVGDPRDRTVIFTVRVPHDPVFSSSI